MTTHATCYDMNNSRTAAPSGVRPDFGFLKTSTGNTANVASSDPLPYPPVPPSAHSGDLIRRVEFVWNTDQPVQAIGFAMGGQSVGSLDGATLANGGALVIPEATGLSGRLSPRQQLNFGGAYAAAIAALAGNPTTVDVLLHMAYRNQSYTGLQHFVEFEEQPPDTPGDGTVRARALLRAIKEGVNTYTLGVDSSGVTVRCDKCSFAAISPEGVVYIEPTDTGANIEQIPPDPADNSSARYRFHPSVFIPAGMGQYIRGLGRQFSDGTAITAGATQALGIVLVDSEVTASNWLVVVDGQAQLLRVTHPAATDYRRPRDIWNNVWVPIIAGSQNILSATSFAEILGTPSQGYVSNRFQYASYFRCLGLPGTYYLQSQA